VKPLERHGVGAQRQPARPGAGEQRRRLELAVRDLGEELRGVARRRQPEAQLPEEDEQQGRHQHRRAQVVGHRRRPVRPALQRARRQVQPGAGQAQGQQRPGHPLDRALQVRQEREHAGAEQEEGAEVERDLGKGEHPALDDPVVLASLQAAVGRAQALALVRVDEAQPLPLPHLVQVRLQTPRQRGLVEAGPGLDRAAGREAAQVERQLARAGIAVRGVGGHGLERHRLQRLRRLVRQLGRQPRPALADGLRQGGVVRALVGPLAAEQLVEDDAQGVDVGAGVDAALGIELFGRHVGQGAAPVARVRIAAAQAEVQHLGLERGVDQHVGGLQVAVLQPQAVRVIERLRHLRQQPRQRRGIEGGPHLGQGEPVHILHQQQRRVAGAEVQHPHDARVVEEGQGAGLAQEVLQAGGQRAVAAQHLGGHDPSQRQVLELVDLAAAAAPQPLHGAEAPEGG
jgi:hypothetical protein